ncbi:uncharacterized protein SPSK_00149 [Sporothrix schenckii 1099-18]|uniref:NADP-dependent oxidoreductase domain-containing protein n=2 Tax=Sporothrix schenckii TaxID=29908 RepID=U7PLQ1_SPOS1|nr:uncharacterized protein SPSK_00149 [Sporothrix schenckii 1099-18]ERS95674.1 hypothetical protein HMPREF1624_07748 [Sporothrix schenckii ATCC 58251]KJR83689.1 hypothetical protein SPSK_00149 [Sporothrix schenckii 1099-18]
MADKYPNRPLIVLGTAGIGDATVDPNVRLDTPEEVGPFFDEFYNRGYRVLDTARNYPPGAPGTAEPRIARHNTDGRFVVDTKVFSFTPGDHNAEGLAKSIDGSIEALGGHPINIEFLHVPERTTPFADTLAALDTFRKQGKFSKVGISNYRPDEVQQMLDISKDKGYAPPAVYQGCYNAISRSIETTLFPVLRANNVAFYAYSPAAGGIFGDKKRPGGRLESSGIVGDIYREMYDRPTIAAAVDRARAVAKEHGIPGHDASLRWTVYHSQLSGAHGDAVIVGAATVEQLKKSLDAIDAGPLPQAVVDAVNAINDSIEEVDKLPWQKF